MKKTTLITCGILLILTLNGCAATSPANTDTTSQSDTTQLPNPWYDYKSSTAPIGRMHDNTYAYSLALSDGIPQTVWIELIKSIH